MTRVKRGAVARKRRKKCAPWTKGAIGVNTFLFRRAKQHTIKALSNAYEGARKRKRNYRKIWNVRLNAIVRIYGWNYSSFIYHLRQKKCLINRKILVQLSHYDPTAFKILLV